MTRKPRSEEFTTEARRARSFCTAMESADLSDQYIDERSSQVRETKSETGLQGFLRNDPLAVQDE